MAGVYRWYSPMDCDRGGANWALSTSFDGKDHEGFMATNIAVL